MKEKKFSASIRAITVGTGLLLVLSASAVFAWHFSTRLPPTNDPSTEKSATLRDSAPSLWTESDLPPVPMDDSMTASADVTCPAIRTDAAYRGKNRIFKYILPGKDGWLFRTADFRKDFTLSDKALDAFQSVNSALAAQGSKLVVLLQPPRGIFANAHMTATELPQGYNPDAARASYKRFIAQLKAQNVAVVDLGEVPADMPYFMKADPHWSVLGARYSAEKAADLIRSFSAYDSIGKEDFSTRIVGKEQHERGDFEEFVLKICGGKASPASVDIWETTPEKEENTTTESLFGDMPMPSIVALGTSNTENDRELNFVGSLEALLSADIYNAALAGGGFGGSAISWFSSDDFRTHPPKIVIWEFLAHHDFEDFRTFRQIVPAIGGACSSSDAVATFDADLSGPAMPMRPLPEEEGDDDKDARMTLTTLFGGLDKKISAPSGHFLYLEATQPIERRVRVGILYSNGDAEEIDLTRSRRTPNNGKYFLALDESQGAIPLLIELGTDRNEGKISARLCSRPMGKLAGKE